MSRWTSPASLVCIATLSLSGCVGGKGTNLYTCPPPQWADEKVAEELESVPFEGHEDFWFWMDRVEKLNEQLELCQ